MKKKKQAEKAEKRKAVSFSKMNLYGRCGEAWRRRYIEKDVAPPTTPAIRGTAVHMGSEINFRQKIKTHKDMKQNHIVEATVDAFEATLKHEGLSMSREETKIGKRKVVGEWKDRAVFLARLYSDEVAPEHQPAVVETLQKIEIAENLDLVVKIDLINDKEEVVDLKTTSKHRIQSEVDDDMQFDIYGLAYLAMNKKHPKAFKQEVLLDQKNPKRQTVVTTRTMDDYRVTVNRINAFLKGTEAGIFMPTNPTNWWCSENWCGYWSTCPYVKNYK